MADRANNKTIYAGMKYRTMNRSEFDDGLLRHNQRFGNRLQLEIQAVEKAQRVIAKGLDKESQWYRQRLSTSSLSPPKTTPIKKNSFSEFGSAGSYNGNGFSNTRLIPDYQYQAGKPSSASSAYKAGYDEDAGQPRRRESKEEGGEDKVRESDKESPKPKRKSTRTKDRERDRDKERERKSRSHHSDKKSSRSSKVTEAGSAENSEAAHAPSSDAPSAESSAGISGLSLVESEKQASTESPKTSSAVKPAPNTAGTSATGTTTSTAKHSHASSTPTIHLTPTTDESTDPDATTTTSSPLTTTLLRDLNWDGRRRYANIWDTLSTPKHTTTNRSVRARLEKELNTKSAAGRASAKQSGMSKHH